MGQLHDNSLFGKFLFAPDGNHQKCKFIPRRRDNTPCLLWEGPGKWGLDRWVRRDSFGCCHPVLFKTGGLSGVLLGSVSSTITGKCLWFDANAGSVRCSSRRLRCGRRGLKRLDTTSLLNVGVLPKTPTVQDTQSVVRQMILWHARIGQ